jgi:membrane-bound lytic murein transglycosylase B
VTAPAPSIARRSFIGGIAGSFATAMLPEQPLAETGFDQWMAAFRSKAIARGITGDTYTRVMEGLRPDTTGLEAIRNQPEFTQKLWQCLNRVTTDWKIAAGREKAKQYAPLLSRIEKDFGIEPGFMLGVWGIESAFGDPVAAQGRNFAGRRLSGSETSRPVA